MNEIRSSGQFVVPGDRLGVIEEFIPDSGTYVKDGYIYSSNVGYVLIDFANKKVSVYPVARNMNVPRVNNIVAGWVASVQSTHATVQIIKVGRKFLSGRFTGIIHISDVSHRYLDNMYDAFRMGDLIRARVVSDKNKTYHLTTKDENLGVLYAFCSQCGDILIKRRRLRCRACGNIEKRKITSDYGKGIL
ncbi:MAG: RNA-binding protein S1 [Candidatus Bathyarchaeota archaeon B63]|nr:MAG: RNA-binding protein S1 [Candidatus Bathyarchaeota archaeon B63]